MALGSTNLRLSNSLFSPERIGRFVVAMIRIITQAINKVNYLCNYFVDWFWGRVRRKKNRTRRLGFMSAVARLSDNVICACDGGLLLGMTRRDC
jgi:hypothetical protein